jgi:hypothetical protein
MKKLAENPLWAKHVATKEQKRIKNMLCPENIGIKIQDRINKVFKTKNKLFIYAK